MPHTAAVDEVRVGAVEVAVDEVRIGAVDEVRIGAVDAAVDAAVSEHKHCYRQLVIALYAL